MSNLPYSSSILLYLSPLQSSLKYLSRVGKFDAKAKMFFKYYLLYTLLVNFYCLCLSMQCDDIHHSRLFHWHQSEHLFNIRQNRQHPSTHQPYNNNNNHNISSIIRPKIYSPNIQGMPLKKTKPKSFNILWQLTNNKQSTFPR